MTDYPQQPKPGCFLFKKNIENTAKCLDNRLIIHYMFSGNRKEMMPIKKVKYIITALVLGAIGYSGPWVALQIKYIYHCLFTISPITLAKINYFNSWDGFLDDTANIALLVSYYVIILFVWFFSRAPQNDSQKLTHRQSDGPKAAGNGEFGTARWMTARERDKIHPVWHIGREKPPAGIPINYNDKKKTINIVTGDKHHLLIGSPGSGKGRRVILPTIWTLAQAGQSIVVTDPKGENYTWTHQYLRRMGYKIIRIDLRRPRLGNRWNIMDPVARAVKQGDTSKAVAESGSNASAFVLSQMPPSNSSDPLWSNASISTIKALQLAVQYGAERESQKSMASVYTILTELGQPTEDGIVPLDRYMDSLPISHPARAAYGSVKLSEGRTRSSILTSAASFISLFSDVNIQDFVQGQDHDMTMVGKEKTAVFLVIPHEDSSKNVLASLYIHQLFKTLTATADETGGTLPVNVYFLLDEFGNLPRIDGFSEKLNVSRSYGIYFLVVLQNLSQLESRYGHNDADSIAAGCNWIFITTSSTRTNEIISKRLGRMTIAVKGVSHGNSNSQTNDHRSYSRGENYSLTGRDLLDTYEVTQQLARNRVLYLSNDQPPLIVNLPDLNNWPYCNRDYGMTADRKENERLRQAREATYMERPFAQPDIWLPRVDTKDNNDDTPKTKQKISLLDY